MSTGLHAELDRLLSSTFVIYADYDFKAFSFSFVAADT
jgi:hypothetical protein